MPTREAETPDHPALLAAKHLGRDQAAQQESRDRDPSREVQPGAGGPNRGRVRDQNLDRDQDLGHEEVRDQEAEVDRGRAASRGPEVDQDHEADLGRVRSLVPEVDPGHAADPGQSLGHAADQDLDHAADPGQRADQEVDRDLQLVEKVVSIMSA